MEEWWLEWDGREQKVGYAEKKLRLWLAGQDYVWRRRQVGHGCSEAAGGGGVVHFAAEIGRVKN